MALTIQRSTEQVAPIIKHGRSYRFGPVVTNYRHPRGWQSVLRVAEDAQEALAVAHSFGADVPPEVSVALPEGHWQIAGRFHATRQPPRLMGNRLYIPFDGEFDSCAVHLRKM